MKNSQRSIRGRSVLWTITLTLCIMGLAELSCLSFTHVQTPTELVEQGAVLTKLAEGYSFSEGPAVDSSGSFWFSDYGNDKIFRLMGDGTIKMVLEGIGGPIGLYFNSKDTMYICAAKAHRIKMKSSTGTVTSLTDRYDGKPFNSPNDIWIDKNDGVYFTDPRFAPLPEDVEQDGMHIYYIPPDGSAIIRVADDLNKPNGIVGSPDGKLLYVTDTAENKTFVYTIAKDGRLSGKRVFADQGYDGMTVDAAGNVYNVMETSIEVYAPDGRNIESIPVPDKPNNVCFAGPDRKTLYITARVSLYSLRMNIAGAK